MTDYISYIDVNSLLMDKIHNTLSAIQSFYQSNKSMVTPCVWEYYLDNSIVIGDDDFESMKTFQIDELDRLKTIKIGINSFTQNKNNYGNDQSKSFHILNCKSLESIQIGRWSFSDYAGDFELKNLPQLQSIQIGTIGSDSCNFSYSSFVIRGIELILNIVMNRSSKSTIHHTGW